MKLRLSLRNLARAARNSLLLTHLILFSGCSFSTTPTYLKENIDTSIQNLCREEYKIDVRVRVVGQTLWVYLPLEEIFAEASKPEKYLEKFNVEHNKTEFKESLLEVDYIVKPVPEKEQLQQYTFDKAALEKISNVWKVLRRVLFSMKNPKEGGLQFFCLVTADIKRGLDMKQVFYYLDLKKVTYEFISWDEYQHRTIQDMEILPQIIGDKEGLYLDYKDITWQEFISEQIQQRIRVKFQKPEVEKNVDIDKEILKTVIYTLKIYDFKDFSQLELNNFLTNNKILLSQAAVSAKFIE